MTLLCAPAGSGKTVLLRSWIGDAAVADGVAWITVGREERDPQRFWLSVLDALRDTCAGSTLVRALSAAPGLDAWAIVERLLEDLDSLDGRLWLVIDDLHELCSDEALRPLELLLMRAPAELRFVLATRHDLPLGLHRLRLEGELTEIRAGDLRFTPDQARELFETAGVELSDSALGRLVEKTEGWAAGLRLAALSLAGHPDPDELAAEFSGSERTVAEYLVTEVLERQPPEVRRLLLRTSVLERVNGQLADLLTGGQGGERTLHELELANAFVVSLGARRSWFRYHHLFADLLALELRRAEPGELLGLHQAAAEWFAEHECPVEAVRHAQAAENWGLAARLLADSWFSLELNGRSGTAHRLLKGFPAPVLAGDPELAALMAGNELNRGSLLEAERHLMLATRMADSVPAGRRGGFQVRLAVVRLWLACQRSNLPAVVEEAQGLLAPAEEPDEAHLGLAQDLRALALISLGIAEAWTARPGEAVPHLEQGVALAARIERPYLELLGLAHLAPAVSLRSIRLTVKHCMQAIELAGKHGWTEEPVAAVAYSQLAGAMVAQGRLEEAGRWLERAERALRPEVQPALHLQIQHGRGLLELARGRDEQALSAFRTAERREAALAEEHTTAAWTRARVLQTRLRLGEADQVEAAIAALDERERETVVMGIVIASLRLAGDDPEGASAALAPALRSDVSHPIWSVEALLLEAIARHLLGDGAAAERALDVAEPDRLLLPFLLYPVAGLLERHSRHRTTHASLVAEILDVLAGKTAPPLLSDGERLREPLSESETRVLRYLPTNLSLREIGNELYVSVHTVKTHIKHIYGKLGVHSRGEAVGRARALGLLAPSSRGGGPGSRRLPGEGSNHSRRVMPNHLGRRETFAA